MRPADNVEKLIKKLRYKANAGTHDRILGNVLQTIDRLEKQKSGVITPNIWRIIMKSRITKLAAAAVLAIAVLIIISQIGGTTPALADIVRPFLTAHTATFKVTIKGQGVPTQEFDGMFMEPCRMRHTQPGGGTVIVDLEQGKFITLLPQLKQAIVLELTNIPEDPGSLNFFQEIRMRILKAQPLDDESVEFLGEKEIDGQSAIGYHVQKPGLDATVWANSETKVPIRIEVFQDTVTVAMSNIVFDVELDESLFSLEIPQGYSVKTIRKNLSEPTEDDFIESFRIWAEHMDGKFPSRMHRSEINEFVKYQQEKMKKKGIEPSIEDITQMQQTIVDMTHGFPFVESLPAESNWHYAGKDVKFGDAESPIFWYRPEGSKTYRVIFGDLHEENIDSERLAELQRLFNE